MAKAAADCGYTGTKVSKKHRKRRRRIYDDDADDDNDSTVGAASVRVANLDSENDETTKWPTHFLALRIADQATLQRVKQLQDHITSGDPSLHSCCMPLEALHLTLCNLGLETPQQVQLAEEFLLQAQPHIAALLPKEPLRVEGVRSFTNQILYARVEPREAVMKLVDGVQDLVRKAGLEVRDKRDKYTPHVTVLKVSYPVARQRKSWTVKPMFYSDFEDTHFGEQRIDTIYLCSMGGKRREDKFYVTHAEIHFDD